LLRVTVEGARSVDEARRFARSIVESPLVKTMAYGADPNIGRILMALGKCFDCEVDAARLVIRVGEVVVFENGVRADFDEPAVRALLGGDPDATRVDAGLGAGRATPYGCALTPGDVAENAAYSSCGWRGGPRRAGSRRGVRGRTAPRLARPAETGV